LAVWLGRFRPYGVLVIAVVVLLSAGVDQVWAALASPWLRKL
jgi:hypothetical protein